MKTLRFALLLAISAVITHAEGATVLSSISVLGGAIRNPQSLSISSPTPLSEITEKCGGILNIWSGIITITKKESEVLSVTRRYQFSKRPIGEERQKILSEIMIHPGEVVFFQEIYD